LQLHRLHYKRHRLEDEEELQLAAIEKDASDTHAVPHLIDTLLLPRLRALHFIFSFVDEVSLIVVDLRLLENHGLGCCSVEGHMVLLQRVLVLNDAAEALEIPEHRGVLEVLVRHGRLEEALVGNGVEHGYLCRCPVATARVLLVATLPHLILFIHEPEAVLLHVALDAVAYVDDGLIPLQVQLDLCLDRKLVRAHVHK